MREWIDTSIGAGSVCTCNNISYRIYCVLQIGLALISRPRFHLFINVVVVECLKKLVGACVRSGTIAIARVNKIALDVRT